PKFSFIPRRKAARKKRLKQAAQVRCRCSGGIPHFLHPLLGSVRQNGPILFSRSGLHWSRSSALWRLSTISTNFAGMPIAIQACMRRQDLVPTLRNLLLGQPLEHCGGSLTTQDRDHFRKNRPCPCRKFLIRRR